MALTKALKQTYKEDVVPALKEKFGYKNIHQVPKLHKVVINMGIGEGSKNSKLIDTAVKELSDIAGQKVVITKAKQSIATYKIREGMPIGCMVTLRGERMYQFLEKLIGVVLPRIRDFRGINSKSFDGRGNYSLGLKEQVLFPEISYDDVEAVRGMDIAIVTTAESDEEARELLTALGMPFKK